MRSFAIMRGGPGAGYAFAASRVCLAASPRNNSKLSIEMRQRNSLPRRPVPATEPRAAETPERQRRLIRAVTDTWFKCFLRSAKPKRRFTLE